MTDSDRTQLEIQQTTGPGPRASGFHRRVPVTAGCSESVQTMARNCQCCLRLSILMVCRIQLEVFRVFSFQLRRLWSPFQERTLAQKSRNTDTSSTWSRRLRRKPEEGCGREDVLAGEHVRAKAQRRSPEEVQSSRATTTALTRRVRGGDDTRCGWRIVDGVLVRSSAPRKA